VKTCTGSCQTLHGSRHVYPPSRVGVRHPVVFDNCIKMPYRGILDNPALTRRALSSCRPSASRISKKTPNMTRKARRSSWP
jgi:hypothetical protein